MLTLGILADHPKAATGMAVVNHNLAYHMSRLYDDEARIIYFGRFGAEEGVAPESVAYEGYEVVNCEGGVWKAKTVEQLVRKYKVDILYSEDDWWSMKGLILGAKRTKKPLYFMTPIDSLPIQREALQLFHKYCRIVFVPNQSYRYIKNGYYLPHAVDWMKIKPVRGKAFKRFTFLLIGRDERRKAFGRAILAFEKIHKKVDCGLVIRSNWGATSMSRNTHQYIKSKKLPIVQDIMTNCEHGYLAHIYSACHAFICPSKAGACEMSIFEAQACGLPVLATDWIFMCENVVHGKSGFLIPIEGYDIREKPKQGGIEGQGRIWGNISIDLLAERMRWLVENPKKAWNMGLWGMNHVRKNYRWSEIAGDMYEVIHEDYENYIKKLR